MIRALLLSTALIVAGPAPTAPTITGEAVVIDGDTLRIGNTRIRLHGIDAPEGDQRCQDDRDRSYNCGSLAADVLAEEIGNAPVSCSPVEQDRYGRTVAVCSVRGVDLGEAIVRRGWALDYKFFSGGRYDAAEREAKAAKRGLWAGKFVPPNEWRRGRER